MASTAETLLEAGATALRTGDWSVARDAFGSVLDIDESGAARFGLGVAAWWLGDTDGALRCWERAYATSLKGGEPADAVLPAVYLCLAYRMSLGNDAASNGWLHRAADLVEEHDVVPLRGWIALCRAYVANDTGQGDAAGSWARDALADAQATGDADLELCATSELGFALVGSGRAEEGAALLDRAMAGALSGAGTELDTVVLVSCRTITACSRAADAKRAVQWIRAADDFNRRYGSTHLYTTCRTHCGLVHFATGDWSQAERELEAAMEGSASVEPALHAEARAALAALRLAQGRVDDAARLLDGYHDHPATALARAAVHLAVGEPAAAASLVRRRLRQVGDDRVERAALLDLLAEAAIASGSREAPPSVVDATEPGSAFVVALDARTRGRLIAATGDTATAVRELEQALDAFSSLGMPLECGRTRLLIAETVAASDRTLAVSEARAALTCFASLGAARHVDAAAAFLRSLGVRAAPSGERGREALTRRELEVLALLGEGLSNPDIATRLFIARKTVEHHVASVLSKLGLRGRAEAAAYAVRHLPDVR